MKISVIGAGNVGATCANVLALKNFATEVVLLDVNLVYPKVKLWI